MNIYIGENIKRYRLQKQITQEQLSVAMGVTCAAVSKWERQETLPDISLLPLLANYFEVSIDELMGYNAAKIEKEIADFFKTRSNLRKEGKLTECIALSKKAFAAYPNDFHVMNTYMWDIAGDYADNDPAVLLANKEEFLSICQRILDHCKETPLRLDAINMQGKILHAEGKTDEAIALYKNELPDWYLTAGQKTEQLFAKDTPEFARQLKWNMLELGRFLSYKKSKEIWFCSNLSTKEKGDAAIALCRALERLRETISLYEIDYYIWCFAKDIAHKVEQTGEGTHLVEQLNSLAEKAGIRFAQYSKTDSDIHKYYKTHC